MPHKKALVIVHADAAQREGTWRELAARFPGRFPGGSVAGELGVQGPSSQEESMAETEWTTGPLGEFRVGMGPSPEAVEYGPGIVAEFSASVPAEAPPHEHQWVLAEKRHEGTMLPEGKELLRVLWFCAGSVQGEKCVEAKVVEYEV